MADTPVVLISPPSDGGADSPLLLLAQRCQQAGIQVVLVPDLYHVPEDAALWQSLRAYEIRAAAGSLHPRPLEWLFRRHRLGDDRIVFVGLQTAADIDGAVQKITEAMGPAAEAAARVELEGPTRPRWYPVMDHGRCVSCGHCMQFCLFGVYALDENGKVTVANPDNCKSGCPACSRICPHSAIMFPLYGRDPAIAGAPGRWVVLDLAGRRLYYNRTGATCPRCGQSGTGPALRPSGAAECPECGRAVAPPKDRPADDLDKLINDLDQLMDRRR